MKRLKRIPEPTEFVTDDELAKKYEKLDAKNYKNKNSSYRIVSKDILKRTKLKKGKILDLGCGYGGLIGVLNEFLPNMDYKGIDASQWIIEFGKKLHKKNSNITLIKCNAEKLPFKKNTFDIILCRDVIHHLKNPIKVLKEMQRVTKKEGLIYIVDLRRDISKKNIYKGLWEFFNEFPTIAINYLYSIRASYTIKEIKKLLKKSKILNYKILKGKGFYFQGRWMAIIKNTKP